jgi:hypothetical protein
MKKKKPGKEQKDKQEQQQDREDLFTAESSSDEIDSDGSANAFEETETVTEDNFDNLSEK